MEAAANRKAPTSRDQDLALKLGSMILLAFRGHAGDVVRVIDESGLSFVQTKALLALEGPGEGAGATVTGLAETLGVSPASASRAVDGLVRKRLVSRLEDSADRRVRRLAPTAKGRDLAERIMAARLAGIEEFTATLEPDERRDLERALETLLRRPELAEIHQTYAKKAGPR